MANKAVAMLTTVDNPYDPFSEFDEWYRYDVVEARHNTCAYLSRIAKTSDAMSDYENDMEIERAIDEIVANDPFDIYRKVKRTNYD